MWCTVHIVQMLQYTTTTICLTILAKRFNQQTTAPSSFPKLIWMFSTCWFNWLRSATMRQLCKDLEENASNHPRPRLSDAFNVKTSMPLYIPAKYTLLGRSFLQYNSTKYRHHRYGKANASQATSSSCCCCSYIGFARRFAAVSPFSFSFSDLPPVYLKSVSRCNWSLVIYWRSLGPRDCETMRVPQCKHPKYSLWDLLCSLALQTLASTYHSAVDRYISQVFGQDPQNGTEWFKLVMIEILTFRCLGLGYETARVRYRMKWMKICGRPNSCSCFKQVDTQITPLWQQLGQTSSNLTDFCWEVAFLWMFFFSAVVRPKKLPRGFEVPEIHWWLWSKI